jgi:CheY-like chemotaxis protein
MYMEIMEDTTVLLVDDEDSNIFALQSYLEHYGIKVVVAKNGLEAIRILENRPDLKIILLDMMMPVMDGFETLNVIKKDPALSRIPVIAVTARAMKGDREKCLEAGATDYISKPVDTQMLLSKINRLVG